MISNVLRLTSMYAGEAKCMNCKHEWLAMPARGVSQHLCPNCKEAKGILTGKVGPSNLKGCVCGSLRFLVDHEFNLLCSQCGLIYCAATVARDVPRSKEPKC